MATELTAQEKAILVGRFTKWTNYEPKIEVITEHDIREWLNKVNAVIEDIPAGEFKESGTNIATCLIIIDK